MKILEFSFELLCEPCSTSHMPFWPSLEWSAVTVEQMAILKGWLVIVYLQLEV